MSMTTSEAQEPSHIVRGLVHLPLESTLVADADEEVFLLYTNLARKSSADGTAGFRGLGHLDSHKDVLTITFDLGVMERARDAAGADGLSAATLSRRSLKKGGKRRSQESPVLFEIELAQDKTALRTRKGDTGSVVWHASVDFAQLILQQCHGRIADAFFNPDILQRSHIVELGAGTGLLAIALSTLVEHYTATDIDALVPLIRKNVMHNLPKISHTPSRTGVDVHPCITVEPLDWTVLHSATPTMRRTLCRFALLDLLLVVDCIYHPSLIPALISTIDHLTVAEHTAVVVVVELRAEDVVREFLERWLKLSPQGAWEIWSVPSLLEGPYAIWMGWKRQFR